MQHLPPLPPRRPQLSRVKSELETLQAQLEREQRAATEAQQAKRPSSESRPPAISRPVESDKARLERHAATARMIATYLSVVGAAVLGLLTQFYAARSDALKDVTRTAGGATLLEQEPPRLLVPVEHGEAERQGWGGRRGKR